MTEMKWVAYLLELSEDSLKEAFTMKVTVRFSRATAILSCSCDFTFSQCSNAHTECMGIILFDQCMSDLDLWVYLYQFRDRKFFK